MADFHTAHRPESFDQVVGQDSVVQSLQSVLKKKSSHAFLFEGPAGTGKTTLSRIIAKEVGCDPRNILEVDAATNTGVDDMRRVTEGMIYNAIGTSKIKTYIIDECHMMSKSAWQSLQKPVEEPPRHVYWMFCTTEIQKVPKTIRTRCVEYRLSPVKTDVIMDLLQEVAEKEKLRTPEDIIYFIAQKADGSPRQALTMLAKCAACTGRKEAADLVKAVEEEGEVRDLCQLLWKGTDWERAMAAVKALGDVQAESVRINIVNYFVQVAMNNSGRKAEAACAILDAFKQPYPSGANIAYVILSLADVLMR